MSSQSMSPPVPRRHHAARAQTDAHRHSTSGRTARAGPAAQTVTTQSGASSRGPSLQTSACPATPCGHGGAPPPPPTDQRPAGRGGR